MQSALLDQPLAAPARAGFDELFDENHEYRYACYTGDYPTDLVNIEELISARQKWK